VTELRKQCASCLEWKLLDEFYRRADGKFGRTARCKVCTARDQALYRQTPGYKLSHGRSIRKFYKTAKGRASRERDKLRLRLKTARRNKARQVTNPTGPNQEEIMLLRGFGNNGAGGII